MSAKLAPTRKDALLETHAGGDDGFMQGGRMNRNKHRSLWPKTLAWVERADGGNVLPVVWFGCLHGSPTRLLIGLRSEATYPDAGAPVSQFSLCWVPNGGEEASVAQRNMLRLHCLHGQLSDEYGTVTLCGQLSGLTVGDRTLSLSQVDVMRLLAPTGKADA
ncbi:hypothetical protein Pcar_2429 [Syntrophotalea carbinolica DSM 2380]|uniref:Uncharacterized protein n=2 Tax=Syntrophotalea carbinolica TaxID=19 RepID=Q3A1T9_SYNC1|nr:hypothetical protein Pcar_2429 [Syntrophotalea carbinolica DSM 2380]